MPQVSQLNPSVRRLEFIAHRNTPGSGVCKHRRADIIAHERIQIKGVQQVFFIGQVFAKQGDADIVGGLVSDAGTEQIVGIDSIQRPVFRRDKQLILITIIGSK